MADHRAQTRLLRDFHIRGRIICGAHFDPEALCFIVKGERVRGLIRPLQKYMHAHTRRVRPLIEARLREWFPPAHVFARSSAHVRAARAAAHTYSGIALRGREHGIRVHRDCQTALCAFLANAYNGDTMIPVQSILREAVPTPDPCVPELLACFADRHLVPLATELPVYCAALRVATAVDVLLRDSVSGELVVVDVKTGAPPALAQHTHSALALHNGALPTRAHGDDPFLEHRLQLALTRRMFTEYFRGKVRAELVYVTPIIPHGAASTAAARVCGHEARIVVCPLGDNFVKWAARLKSIDDFPLSSQDP